MSFPIIGILYSDDPNASYAGVTLSMDRGSSIEVFDTGNPTVDYHTAMLVVWRRHVLSGGSPDVNPHVMGSSSIDHFVMDGGDLRDEDPTQEEVGAAVAAAKDYLMTPLERLAEAAEED